MLNKFNLKIKDFRKSNNAKIELNKINVIGGSNASGKPLQVNYLKII